MRKIRIFLTGLFWVLVWFAFPLVGQAQDEVFEIRLNRTWGYGGFGEIQGLFTLKARGPEDLILVTYFLDGDVMAEVNEAPFDFRFQTDDYPLGVHTFTATGVTANGETLSSNEITTKFVPASQGWETVSKILIPLFAIVAIALLLSVGITFYAGKKRLNPPAGTERKYGFFGGAICPKCNRPTPVHWFGLNLGSRKYDRCENCLKWSNMKVLSISSLRQAEADELERSKAEEDALIAGNLSEEAKLKKEIEESRFHDL